LGEGGRNAKKANVMEIRLDSRGQGEKEGYRGSKQMRTSDIKKNQGHLPGERWPPAVKSLRKAEKNKLRVYSGAKEPTEELSRKRNGRPPAKKKDKTKDGKAQTFASFSWKIFKKGRRSPKGQKK